MIEAIELAAAILVAFVAAPFVVPLAWVGVSIVFGLSKLSL
jgi:hypothetical protein